MASRSQRSKRKAKRRLVNVQVNEISLVDNPAVPEATFVVAKRDAAESEGEAVAEELAKDEELVEEQVETQPEDAGAADGEQADEAGATEPVAKEDGGGEPLVVGDPEAPEPEGVLLGKDLIDEGAEELEKGSDSWLKAIKVLRSSAGDLDPPGLHLLASIIEYTAFKYQDDEAVKNALMKMGVSEDAVAAMVEAREDGQDTPEVQEDVEDLEKATRVLGPTAFAKIEEAAGAIAEAAGAILSVTKSAKKITKAEDEAGEETPDEGEAVPDPEEVEKAEPEKPDILRQAGRLMRKRRDEAKAQSHRAAAAKLGELAPKLEELLAKQNELDQKLVRATGKV